MQARDGFCLNKLTLISPLMLTNASSPVLADGVSGASTRETGK
jgi:hypothetical protein